MTKSVFTSFHYDLDYWRVQQVLNMGLIEGQQILDAQTWESVKREGDEAIKRWINAQMKGKTAVVVLVGSQTSTRPWVLYEIARAWDNYIPLVGIRIHGLKDSSGQTSLAGGDPFEKVSLTGGGTVADHVQLFNPSGYTSQQVYANIQANLPKWMDQAKARRRA